MSKIVIVQGGNWGSEAKGMVALALCERDGIDYAVRTGSVNAGHTVVRDGKKVAFQQLPTGSVLRDIRLVLGPGTYVNRDTLMNEINVARCAGRVYVDRNCGVHLDEYSGEAALEKRNQKIGATGKGCAEAIIHKIKDRGVGVSLLFRNFIDDECLSCVRFYDTAELLTDAYGRGEKILIEGTQGTHLDFHCGPYPFVTSRQSIASAWVAECGLSPALDYEVVLVVRTYPIRVAGHSGPMGNEITWPTLARRMNVRLRERGLEDIIAWWHLAEFEACKAKALTMQELYENESDMLLRNDTEALKMMSLDGYEAVKKLFETTTVTKRLRRIAELDVRQLVMTVHKERPAYIVLTFLNYVFPELSGKVEIHKEALVYVEQLQRAVNCRIKYVTVGPRSDDMIEVSV